MTLPSAPVPVASEVTRPTGSSEVDEVGELFRSLVKAVRAHQLYLPNNPMYAKALETVRTAFQQVWAITPELQLVVTETDLRMGETSVFHDGERSPDSLPWLLYKDGVREIVFRPGFEEDELVGLLAIIKRLRVASPDEDDLLSMLWEQDFGYLRYRFVDLALEAVQPLTAEPPVGTHQISVAQTEPDETAPRAGVVSLEDFDATLYFLDDAEIAYLRGEVRDEYERDLPTNVTGVILDIFEAQEADDVRAEICSLLDTLLVHFLAAGHFRAAARLLLESATTAKRAKGVNEASRIALTALPERLSAPESLRQLLESLDDAADLPPETELAELFEQLRPRALETVFGSLNKIQSPRVRSMLEAAAERLAGQNTAELVRLIGSRDPDVALEAMRRAAALKTAAAVAPLGKALAEPDPKLRLAAVQALTEIASAGALQQLERGVEDSDREVRIATIKALGAKAYRLALPRVRAAVEGRVAREADLTERMAFFETFGVLAGDAGVQHLDEILNGKGLFGRRADPELRACAAMALGRIATVRAMESARRAANDKELLVRNAVAKALRGAST
ncbi:MAG: hypothetical protein NVS1B4_10970 [Gemmatimonadaceae bacterium]